MKSFKRSLLALTIAGALATGAAHAQMTNNAVKIGVLSDMSSLYTDLAGAGSVLAAKMAVEDSGIEKRGVKVEIVSADHQNKPDVGSAIARRSGTRSIPTTRDAPRCSAIRADICPIGPSPSTTTVPPGGTSAYSTACHAVGTTSER